MSQTQTRQPGAAQREADRRAAEVDAQVADIRRQAAQNRGEAARRAALATSREARAADAVPPAPQDRPRSGASSPAPEPAAAPVIRDRRQPGAVMQPDGPVIKGAVKVDGFPSQCKYPFREIAGDGGVWELDPAAFKVQPQSIRAAAANWAKDHDLTVKSMADGGFVYVQFTSKAAAR